MAELQVRFECVRCGATEIRALGGGGWSATTPSPPDGWLQFSETGRRGVRDACCDCAAAVLAPLIEPRGDDAWRVRAGGAALVLSCDDFPELRGLTSEGVMLAFVRAWGAPRGLILQALADEEA